MRVPRWTTATMVGWLMGCLTLSTRCPQRGRPGKSSKPITLTFATDRHARRRPGGGNGARACSKL